MKSVDMSMKKAKKPEEASRLDQLPSVGTKTSKYLSLAGVHTPKDLIGKDPYMLYVRLCEREKSYYDPCLLDQFIAATEFMNTGKNRDWWKYTSSRKKNFHLVSERVLRFKN